MLRHVVRRVGAFVLRILSPDAALFAGGATHRHGIVQYGFPPAQRVTPTVCQFHADEHIVTGLIVVFIRINEGIINCRFTSDDAVGRRDLPAAVLV